MSHDQRHDDHRSTRLHSSAERDGVNRLGPSWRRLSRKSKALVIALVAILAGWSTIKSQAIDPIRTIYSNKQPGHDERTLAALRAGTSFEEFQRRIGTASEAVLRPDVTFTYLSKRVHARDEIFKLETAFVEAFVDDKQKVLGYAITARTSEMPSVKLPGRTYALGRDRVASALSSVRGAASVCAAHIAAYYEVSATSNAELLQTVAVGFTSAGPAPRGFGLTSFCPDSSIEDLPLAPGSTSPRDLELYVLDEHLVDQRYLKQHAAPRSAPINTVAITAPGVDLAPEMISLHPDFVASL